MYLPLRALPSILRVAWPFVACCLAAQSASAATPEIIPNTNEVGAGRPSEGVLELELVAQEGLWYPETKDGPPIPVQAFGERGKPLSVPGPLVRVLEGTLIRATVRNELSVELRLHGLHTRPGDAKDIARIAPGQTQAFEFEAGTPGTYHYHGATMDGDRISGWPLYKDAQLTGAFVVDPKDAKDIPNDRIFVIGIWHEDPELDAQLRDVSLSPAERTRLRALQRIAYTINGLSWPYTEQLTYRQHEPVHWRIINTTYLGHPMHLHGFYFNVISIGDGERDVHYAGENRPHVVTQLMPVGGTMALTFTPERAGNWLFHCHMIGHISPRHRLRPRLVSIEPHKHDDSHHLSEGMAGLVMGLRVLPTTDSKPRPTIEQRRKLNLFIQEQADYFGREPALGYSLQQGSTQPAPDKVDLPGPTIVLARGEPVSINIVSRIQEPTSIHWHGIELESYFDGVPGWGGHAGSITPSIAPGGSFVAEMTPPRAGTFIYHTHSHDDRQLASGMYGPLIVLEPGGKYDPETDRLLMISLAGPQAAKLPVPEVPLLLNGKAEPELKDLRVGTTYRFRLINITADNAAFNMHLLSGDDYVSWRALAKDGADLPASQRIMKPAQQTVTVGETYDFEYRPDKPGDLRFEVRTGRAVTRIATAMRVRY
jgi:FtsP/CotA-like multicopper oxidase with cupredoxin domain